MQHVKTESNSNLVPSSVTVVNLFHVVSSPIQNTFKTQKCNSRPQCKVHVKTTRSQFRLPYTRILMKHCVKPVTFHHITLGSCKSLLSQIQTTGYTYLPTTTPLESIQTLAVLSICRTLGYNHSQNHPTYQ